MKTRIAIVAAASAGLALTPAATAHVTVNPEKATAGSFNRFDLRVPTEEDVPTVKVRVQLPAGLEEVTFQPKPGWKRTVEGRVVTWSGGKIEPEEFDDFAFSMEVPDTPGKELVFPTLQTYAGGKVVRWIEAESGQFPAPRLTIETAEGGTSATTATSAETEDDDHDELALGFGIAGLAAGLLALGVALVRRRRA
jgi:uncharacterized protein YcnI